MTTAHNSTGLGMGLRTSHRVPGVLAALALLAALLALPQAPTLAPLDAPGGTARLYLVGEGIALPTGARIVERLPVAGALVVSSAVAPEGAVPAEAPLGGWKLLAAPQDGSPRLDSGVASTGAPAVWDRTRGEQAVVALIDTGVAPVPALEDAIAGEIDFTGTGGGDPYGHGTFLASLIAGRGEVAPGVAPGTGVLSLKVGAADGSTDLVTVLGAMQWLYGPGRAAGIRIAALALGVDPADPGAQMLDHATQVLADRGILVISAAGNEGPGALTSPATSTGSFSVGAVDDRGTADRADDIAAQFSGDGPDRAGVAQPDAVASGVSVVGSIPADSAIALANPQGVVEEQWFRGSGTSMATALTAGVAALVSSARPDLDGPSVGEALRAGGGGIDAPAALAAADGMPPSPDGPADPPGQGNGKGQSNGKGQGKSHGKGDSPGHGRGQGGKSGEAEPQAVRWTAVRWTAVRWTGKSWGDASWSGSKWGAVRWTGDGWIGEHYDGSAFGAVRWTAVRWTAVRWTLLTGHERT